MFLVRKRVTFHGSVLFFVLAPEHVTGGPKAGTADILDISNISIYL